MLITCPLCGEKMIAREGKSGRFWGCQKYPGCRGTRAISFQPEERDRRRTMAQEDEEWRKKAEEFQ